MKGPNIILAGPGTGKTTFLVRKIIDLIDNANSKNDGIIVCTFTNKAAEELKLRIYEQCSIEKISKVNFIVGTIHSICYELLARYSDKDFGDFQILTGENQVHFIYTKLKNLGFSNDKIKKDGWVLSEELASVFNKITDEEIDIDKINFNDNEFLEDACKVYTTYKKLLLKNKLFDFATIQSSLLYELINCNINDLISNDYKYFLIDEYQDVNNIQNEIFLKLSKPNYNLTLVGDDDQSIYGFRGANVEHIKNIDLFFKEQNINVHIQFLSTNYRSTDSIVNFSNQLIRNAKYKRIEKNITPDRKTISHVPVVNYLNSEQEEVEFICNQILLLKKEQIVKSYSEIAILYRSLKSHGNLLIKELTERNIPYKLFGAGDLFNSALGLEIIALIDFYLARDIDKESDFFDKIAQIDVKFNKNITTVYSEYLYLEVLNKHFNDKVYFSCIDLLYDILILTSFFNRYKDEEQNIGSITSLVLNFDTFSNFYDPWGLYSYLTYLKKAQNIDYLLNYNTDEINIMTIHQSKGLEFPIVFMPSQIERSKKKTVLDKFNDLVFGNKSEDEEELRVIYVGVTRAEELLVISGSTYLSSTKKEYPQNKFLTTIKKKIKKEIDYNLLNQQKFRKNNKSNKKSTVLSYNRIRLYESCPRAYMYSNIWNLQTIRIGGLEYGRNIHKILESIIREVIQGKLINNIDINIIIEDNWKNANFRSDEENEKFKSAATTQIFFFIKTFNDYLKKENIFSVEEEFNVTIDDDLITGRFDAVFKINDDFVIVDFKTGEPKDYTSQLSFYSLCFKEKYRVENVKIAVFYLKNGLFQYIVPNDEVFEKEKIMKISSDIQNNNFIQTPGKVCKNCAFNNICEYSI